ALTERADLGHVRSHDRVASLWHPLDRFDRTHRLDAKAEKHDAKFGSDRNDFLNVLDELTVSAVDARALLATQLELSTRLDGDVGVTTSERDDSAAFHFRLPAEP